jgi:outer membrane receptor protein involved in Fe transport
VRASGFTEIEQPWNARAGKSPVEIVLVPEAIIDRVTVTATRTQTRLSDGAATTVVITADDLANTSALTVDDALRQVPGFSLFRRSGSRTANPTTQGVSLRGVGASGASRALVLHDGVPLTDPFGGWIYWGRVPRESIEQIEVVRGGESHLYGTDALGGVINFIPRNTEPATLSLEASYGNQTTPSTSLFAAGSKGNWSGALSAQVFHTDGYVLVDEDQRGRVDTAAGAEHSTIDLYVSRQVRESGRLFARGSVFGEARENGTPVQQNRTHIRQLAAGLEHSNSSVGSVAIRFYGGAQVFDQDFSAIAADRNSETITRSQRVPAQQFGLTSQWSRSLGSRHTLVAGVEAREVRGASNELVFVSGSLSSAVGAGGRERTFGIYGEDVIRLSPRWLATIGTRVDRWRNYDALSTSRPLAQPGPVAVTEFGERTESAFSPHLSLTHRLTDNVSLQASGYRAFRAPTLNELYRSFRVGNIFTLANADLRAERLTGAEAGATLIALNRRLTLRGNYFWSETTRPVANVTLAVAPALITRQRQNLGRTGSQGVDIDVSAQIGPRLLFTGGYEFVDASVIEFPANRTLEGLRIPQVPRHQLTFQARYSSPSRLSVGIQGRVVGTQFDDDQNQFALDRFFTLDALVSHPVARGVDLFAAFENLFDQDYAIGRTPVRTAGPPFLARFGIRLHFGAR